MQVKRFFAVKPSTYSKYYFNLMPDSDSLPLTVLGNALPVYSDSDKVILNTLLTQSDLNALVDITETADPLTLEAVVAADIINSYKGEEYSSVPVIGLFSYYPELQGTEIKGQDEDGLNIYGDIVRRITWSGE